MESRIQDRDTFPLDTQESADTNIGQCDIEQYDPRVLTIPLKPPPGADKVRGPMIKCPPNLQKHLLSRQIVCDCKPAGFRF
ncbi:MAG: hypothetical protein P8X79_22300 [Reinekea sp.]